MFQKAANQTLTRGVAKAKEKSPVTRTRRGPRGTRLLSLLIIAAAMTFASLVSAKHFGDWGLPVNMESIPGTNAELNSTGNDGYPVMSPDGLSLYIVSDRVPAGIGGLDILVSTRANTDDPWGAPENLGPTINTSGNDWGPAPVPGYGLFFVSTRADSCGVDDIYFTRFKNGSWEEPQNVGCQINSTAFDFGPSYFEDESGNGILYFSSNRTGGFEPGGNDFDIYFSVNFGPAQLAPGLNTAFTDSRPYVSKDGREIVFDSNRPSGLGLLDIYTANRETTADDWAPPTNLGPTINSAGNDARPTLSRDGLTMFFGSNRSGSELLPSGQPSSDLYMTTREKLTGDDN